jgi:hypothetical protein
VSGPASDPQPAELEEWIQYWFPLVGLALAEPRAFIHGALLEQPTYADWAGLERTDVAALRQYARMTEAAGLEVTNTLPVCLVILADPRDVPADSGEPPLQVLWPRALALADAVLYGLWLHKRGNVLPPELFGLYADSSDGFVSRIPGVYRQELPSKIDDGYVLTTEDVASVEKLVELVHRYRARAANSSADLALDNLRASYGWHSSAVDRLVVLFAGLEAVVGGYNARDEPFAHVPMPVRAAIAAGAGVADDDARSFLSGPGRELRNAVAHGGELTDDEQVAGEIQALRDILRRALAGYLAFCLDAAESSREGEARSPMVEFNLVLAAAAG